jgi:hypothetical protein
MTQEPEIQNVYLQHFSKKKKKFSTGQASFNISKRTPEQILKYQRN